MCVCGNYPSKNDGFLDLFVESRSGDFSELVANNSYIPIQYCFYCGSLCKTQPSTDSEIDKNVTPDSSEIDCACGKMEKLASRESSYIEFDKIFGAYCHVFGEGIGKLFYCYFCGGKLPEGNDRFLCGSQSPDEKVSVLDSVKNVTTFEELVKKFGESNYHKETSSLSKLTNKRIVRIHSFKDLAESLTLVANEMDDGTAELYTIPKYRDDMYTVPNADSTSRIEERVNDASSSKDVISVLGMPEKHYVFDQSPAIRERLEYRSLDPTFVLIVFVLVGGGIDLRFLGRIKEKEFQLLIQKATSGQY